MHLGVFIYARTDSRRLPRKVLRPFGQSTLLNHVIDRARQVQGTTWALLTSDRAIDDPLATAASDAGLDIVRGSATDLISRTIAAIDTLQVDCFVRINADSPLFEPRLVNAALDRSSGQSLVSNLAERRFPYGVAVEIVGTTLYRCLADAARPNELEHVTQHLYRHVHAGNVVSLTQQADHSHHRLTVDTLEDHTRVNTLFNPPVSQNAPYWDLLGLETPVLHWNVFSGPLED